MFSHIRMDESADARRILTAVPQSDWRRPVGRPHSSWMATLKNDLSLQTSPLRMLWPWISRCGDYWQQAELRTDGACRIMMRMMMCFQGSERSLVQDVVKKSEVVIPLEMFESRARQRRLPADHLLMPSPLTVCSRCGLSVHQSELFD